MADNTKYIYNGLEYNKSRLVLAVVKHYVSENNPSFEELEEAFPSSLQGSSGVIISADALDEKKQSSSDSNDRYFVKDDEKITTSDGITIFVSNQWGADGKTTKGNIDKFIEKAVSLGYEIEPKHETVTDLQIILSEGAIKNGYIRIPSNQELFAQKYIAKNENDSLVTLFNLVSDDGTEFNTYILGNRGRLKQRFNAYFRLHNIQPGTTVTFIKLDNGKYSMTFNNETKSIKELFEEYKQNPYSKWIATFTKANSELLKYKDKRPHDYDALLLTEAWKKPHNGVCSVKPGFISNAEFNKLFDDLPGITSKIVKNPTPSTLTEVEAWAKVAKSKGKFDKIKWGVINRVFSTANPRDCSTLLNENKVIDLINNLNELYGTNISTSGNWAALNLALMNALRSEGLENEDVFILNTFVWKLYRMLVDKKIPEEDEIQNKDNVTEFMNGKTCVNIIYYGPPGTGKTYQLQKMLKSDYTDSSTSTDKITWLKTRLENLNWFEVVTLVLLDANKPINVPEITDHEYFKLKIEINGLKKNIHQAAWAALQPHAIPDSETVKFENKREPAVFDKNINSAWFIVDSKKDQLDAYRDLLEELKAGPKSGEIVKRYEFVTFHQSYGYEEFIEGLRPITNDGGDISYEVKPGVFKRICARSESDPENQYAIVIDEINRGNISKIFGELITLVETDKRAGSENELTLTLPYSGLPFCVPSNLNIIGTMNTADRSLTYIDVALRRRFDFKELRTDYSLIAKDVDGINLRHMLYAINQRIELLLDREHILGHALLMKVSSIDDLKHTFKTNIMPLLEEYFFENWDKINLVLNNNSFVEEQEGAYSTWLSEGDDYAAKSYRINYSALGAIDEYKRIYSGIDPSAFTECEKAAEES